MALNASISITVSPLPENDVWFANAQAWSNYWKNCEGEVEIEPAETTPYLALDYDNALAPVAIEYNGTQYVLVTTAMFESLLAKVNALDTSYQTLRHELVEGSLISDE